jgi:hypothetical protein
MKEAEHLFDIESKRAEQRKLSTLKQGSEIPVKAMLPEREKGQARDIVAEKVGMKARTFDIRWCQHWHHRRQRKNPLAQCCASGKI